MPYATNRVDDVGTYFEDAGDSGPPVLFYTGFADPLEVAKASRLARALSGDFRLVFADHREQGGVPCLIGAGEADEMHDAAKRAADEIPSAKFVSLAGHSHISAFYEADDLLLPHILGLLRSATPTPS
jgi:hypothetical protein